VSNHSAINLKLIAAKFTKYLWK